MTSTTPPIADLLRIHNIFDGHQVVKKSQVWGENFPEVPTINSHASDAVCEAIGQVRSGNCQVRGMTITADKGLGKSHIISRIRHRFQSESGTLFIYMGEYKDLNQIKSEFLQTLASSFKQHGSQEVMQWQELAVALLNEAYNKSSVPKDLVNKFSGTLAKTPNLLDRLTAKVIQLKPDIDPYLIRAILWTLSEIHAPFAIKWISGEELANSQADIMGLPTVALDASKTLCQVLDIISDRRIPIVCFDELDGVGIDKSGFTRAQVVASLVKDLYNQIKRGVFLTAMYPSTWQFQIEAMPDADAVKDRIAEFGSGKPIALRNLNSDEVVALVSQRLKKLCEEQGISLPHPVYPFDEDELRKLGKQGLTAREVLTWCADKIKEPKDKQVELAFNEELESLSDFMEDEDKIAQALIFGFNTIIGQTVDRVRVDKVEAPITPRTNKIDFKIIGEDDGKEVKIGVAVIQASGGVGIQSRLRALTEYKTYNLTRGCFVRSKTIAPAARVAEQYRKQLVEQQGGEWVKLKEEEIKQLIAIWLVYQNRESRNLSEKQIFDFIAEKGVEKQLGASNPLIKEILSDPSGQVPEGLFDEDALFEEASTMPSETPHFFDDAGLDALLESIVQGKSEQ